MQQFRQGDVYVAQVKNRARTGKPISDQGRVILAYGEHTGHAHQVVAGRIELTEMPYDPRESMPDFEGTVPQRVKQANAVVDHNAMPPAQLFEEPDGTRYLFVDSPCLLVHQEHGPISLTPGCWKVTRQREYVAADLNRSVAD